MECQSVISSLSNFVDDGLQIHERRLVEEHLSACVRCQSITQDLTGLRQAAQDLPLHTPRGQLWVRIRAEAESEMSSNVRIIAAPQPVSWWDRLRQRRLTFTLPEFAGAGILAAALMIPSGYLIREYLAEKPALNARDGAASVLLPELDDLMKRQVAEFNQRKVSWEPSVRSGFEGHLQQLDEAIEECRVSISRNPGDQMQRELYRTLVDEKIRLLKDSSRLKW